MIKVRLKETVYLLYSFRIFYVKKKTCENSTSSNSNQIKEDFFRLLMIIDVYTFNITYMRLLFKMEDKIYS